MAWMESDYSKHTHFQWKIKWWLEHLGALGIMGLRFNISLSLQWPSVLYHSSQTTVELLCHPTDQLLVPLRHFHVMLTTTLLMVTP